jgi:membrane-bound ClpP family serine protease
MLLFGIILIIITGIILLVLEILVLPGMIAGIIGSLLMLTGILMIYGNYGRTAGHISVLITGIVTVFSLWYSFKSKAWKRFSLEKSSEGKIQRVDELGIKPGDVGIALSAVRPMGTAIFNGTKVEVQSMSEMIPTNSSIEVIEVLSNKLIVRKK